MLHRLLGIGSFYASVFKENPPAPENKSMNKKNISLQKKSATRRTSNNKIKWSDCATIVHAITFYFPTFLETTIKLIIAKMTKRSIPKKRIISPIFILINYNHLTKKVKSFLKTVTHKLQQFFTNIIARYK